MGFSQLATAFRTLLLLVFGAAAMLAWINGLYASVLLALLLAAWTGAIAMVSARRWDRSESFAPPPPVDDDARERRRLTAYLNLSPAPLVTLDGEDRLRTVNRSARRLFSAEDLVPDAPPALVEAIAATAPGRSATVVLAIGGDARSFALATADLDIGPAATRIAALIDIHAELKAAEAAALRDLLQVLSHEIMNALTPIASLGRTAAQMLEAPDADLAAAHDAVETVARRAEGLQRFSESYRDLARLPSPVIGSIELRAFLADLERLFATRWADATLVIDAGLAPVSIRGDADQLSAALWALLQNAVEAVPQGNATVTLAVAAAVEGVLWRIGDNGPGIAVTDSEAIFRPFFTTKAAGSGVGLALARQILRAHRGDLTLAYPQPPRGALFEALIA